MFHIHDPLQLVNSLLKPSEERNKHGNRIGPGRSSLRKNWPGDRTKRKSWRNDYQAAQRYRRQLGKD